MQNKSGIAGFFLGLFLSLAAAGTLLIIGGFLTFVSLISGGIEPLPGTTSEQRADAIVVLTGGDDRLANGMTLLSLGHGQRLLISGVNEAVGRDEIRKLIAPAAWSQFDCCVDLDKSATNTISNADETARWAQEHNYSRIIVVTASYHMPRSLAEMNRAAPQIRFIPHAVYPADVHLDDWWRWPGSARLLISEYMKYLAMQIRFRLEKA